MRRVLRVEALVRRRDALTRATRRASAPRRSRASSSDPGRRCASAKRRRIDLDAVERVAQPAQVQLAQLVELGAQQPLRVGVLGIALEHIEAATVEVEVARAAAEPPVDLGVVALTLLPSGGDQRDRAVDTERRDLRRQVDPVEWPEQGHLPHEARTRTVSPTTLSMWWTVSKSGCAMRIQALAMYPASTGCVGVPLGGQVLSRIHSPNWRCTSSRPS